MMAWRVKSHSSAANQRKKRTDNQDTSLRKQMTTYASEDVGKRTFIHSWGGTTGSHSGNQCEIYISELPYEPALTLPGIYMKESYHK